MFHSFLQKVLPLSDKAEKYGSKGGIIGPLFHFIISQMFAALVKLNVTARMAINTLGLQNDQHKFDDILKEKEGKAFSQTSARVPTCPADRVSWHKVKIHGNARYSAFFT